jgi:2,4-dienoyl-CoA reductase-like NADH-dependent reductase (Old Yellow Enzyme family)
MDICSTNSCATAPTGTDAYGGSIQKRARFPLEVGEAVVGVWGSQRVGYKLFPHFAGYSMSTPTRPKRFRISQSN